MENSICTGMPNLNISAYQAFLIGCYVMAVYVIISVFRI